MKEYDQIADWYVATRKDDIGPVEVSNFSAPLKPQAKVLDLGSGSGIPVTKVLADRGFQVFAVDSSQALVQKFRANFPEIPIQCADILGFDYFNQTFDAIVAWGVLFHLTATQQDQVFARVSEVLNTKGRFLFTSGSREGTTISEMNGITFHYHSLKPDQYQKLLKNRGLTLVRHYEDRARNHIYLTEKDRT